MERGAATPGTPDTPDTPGTESPKSGLAHGTEIPASIADPGVHQQPLQHDWDGEGFVLQQLPDEAGMGQLNAGNHITHKVA